MNRSVLAGILVGAISIGSVRLLAATEELRPTGRPASPSPMVSPGVPHPGSDQIYWVPTFAQAEDLAEATGRLMLVIGSVSDWNGY